jgi:filamentous hemagglutinin family protein
MITSWNNWGSQLALASCVIVGRAIASANCAFAQITPDGTLPNNSSVRTQDNIRIIEGGTQAGSNLFHSFQEFSVPTGGTAFFNNALDIQNIISRVTGKSISNIDGLIRANGTANLFLLNPNGIIFGRNASLNIGGSFVASTASSLKFSDGTEFSTKSPQTTPLLTVSVPIGLQYGETAGSIRNLSQATNSDSVGVGLQVEPSETLALVGGYVELDGGILRAPGGRVELGGLAQLGTVALDFTGNNLSLNFPQNVQRADVSLINSADVNVRADGGGSIAINAQNLNMSGGSRLRAGINSDLSSIGSQAGNVEINATGIVNINDSFIFNALLPRSVGKGGDINITTGSLSLTNEASLDAGTRGQGDAGSVKIDARDIVTFDGGNIFSNVVIGAVGTAGNINITTGSLSLSNNAQLVAGTRGQGNAGNVTINARDTVSLDSAVGQNSTAVFSTVGREAVGKGGNINITTGSLSLTNGSNLAASTFGQGDAGNVVINARDTVSLAGVKSSSSRVPSAVFSTVEREAVGKGGNINITTGSLSLTNGAQILVGNRAGQGDAGNVVINARDRVFLDGVGSNGFSSAVLSTVEREAVGKGGNINITTGSLSLTNGARLTASTLGQGDAGNVVIHARDTVFLDGVGSNGFSSAVLSALGQGAVGKSGNINITTGSFSMTNAAQLIASTDGQGYAGNINITTGLFSMTNGAQLFTSTGGQGDAGNVVINAYNSVSLDSSSAVFSAVEREAIGKGGNMDITTTSLSLTNGAQLIASTDGQGDAGNIQIRASDTVKISGTDTKGLSSALFAVTLPTSTGAGGSITVDTGVFYLSNGALLDTRTSNNRKGGDITVNARSFEAINGGQMLTITQGSGHAGKITVNGTKQVTVSGSDNTFNKRVAQFGTDVRNLGPASGFFVQSERGGIAGDIEVSAPFIFFNNQGRLIAESASGNGGNIILKVQDLLLLRRGSIISTTAGTAQQPGDGGNITINTPNGFIVAVPSEDSNISANAFTGKGGRVDITAQGIFGIQSRPSPTSLSDITVSSEFGIDGTVELNTPDVDLSRGLVNLPAVPVDTKVAQGCTAGGSQAQSEFIITGRGGLPPNPGEALSTDAVQVDLITLNPEVAQSSTTAVSTNPTSPTPARIIEATGWVIDADGNVVLTANAPTVTPHSSWQRTADCRAFNQQPRG